MSSLAARFILVPPAAQTRCPEVCNDFVIKSRVARPRAMRAKGIATAVLNNAISTMAAKIR
jgi:hypothetical protein